MALVDELRNENQQLREAIEDMNAVLDAAVESLGLDL